MYTHLLWYYTENYYTQKYLKPDKGMLKSIMSIGFPAFEQMIFKVESLRYKNCCEFRNVSLAAHAVKQQKCYHIYRV